VLVVGPDAHEAKLSIAAIPSRKINIFIDEFLLAGGSVQMPHTDVFFARFLQKRCDFMVAVLLNQRSRVFVADRLGNVAAIRP